MGWYAHTFFHFDSRICFIQVISVTGTWSDEDIDLEHLFFQVRYYCSIRSLLALHVSLNKRCSRRVERRSCRAVTEVIPNVLRHGFPQLNSPLVKACDAPQKSLHSGTVLIQSQKLTKAKCIQYAREKYAQRRSIARKHSVRPQSFGNAFILQEKRTNKNRKIGADQKYECRINWKYYRRSGVYQCKKTHLQVIIWFSAGQRVCLGRNKRNGATNTSYIRGVEYQLCVIGKI